MIPYSVIVNIHQEDMVNMSLIVTKQYPGIMTMTEVENDIMRFLKSHMNFKHIEITNINKDNYDSNSCGCLK